MTEIGLIVQEKIGKPTRSPLSLTNSANMERIPDGWNRTNNLRIMISLHYHCATSECLIPFH